MSVMHCNIFGAGDVAEGRAGCRFCPRSSRSLSFVFREIFDGADISVAATTARLLNRRHARFASVEPPHPQLSPGRVRLATDGGPRVRLVVSLPPPIALWRMTLVAHGWGVIAAHGTPASFAAFILKRDPFAAPLMEGAMTANPRPNQDDLNQTSAQRGSDTLHSRVYALLIGFAAWFALAVWSFAGSGVTDYLLVIVSGFIFIVVALQLILSCVGRTNDAAASRQSAVIARLGGRRFRDLARPPQRRASRAPRPAAGCCCGGWHDRVRYRFPHRGTWGDMAVGLSRAAPYPF